MEEEKGDSMEVTMTQPYSYNNFYKFSGGKNSKESSQGILSMQKGKGDRMRNTISNFNTNNHYIQSNNLISGGDGFI